MAMAPPDAATALERLGAALGALAPRLAPCPAPAPAGTAAAAALGRLYGEEAVARLMQGLEAGPSAAACGLCGGPRGAGPAQGCCGLQWDADLARRRLAPSRCLLLCSKCSAIRDLPALIGQLTKQPALAEKGDTAVASDLLRHFLQVNGHDAADAHYLQDAVSVAYAMSVLYKELRLQPSQGPELAQLFASRAADAGVSASSQVKVLPASGGGAAGTTTSNGQAAGKQRGKRKRPAKAPT